ncbi:hypothetical protein F4679DRAFT_566723 [Xylaria curta]|nr:hypothetical protein F4679DRAFT_566723 [Xylaria curta]
MVVEIDAMSMIYEHSYFPIIAADELNSDSDLLGMSPRAINQIMLEVLPCLNSVLVYAIGDTLAGRLRFTRFQKFHL